MTDENKTRVFSTWNYDITDKELLILSGYYMKQPIKDSTLKVTSDINMINWSERNELTGKHYTVYTLFDADGKLNEPAFNFFKTEEISGKFYYSGITEDDLRAVFKSNVSDKTDKQHFEHKLKLAENFLKDNYIDVNDVSNVDIMKIRLEKLFSEVHLRHSYNSFKRNLKLENEKIERIDDVQKVDASGSNGNKGTFTIHKTNGKEKKMFIKYNHFHTELGSFNGDLIVNKLFNGKKTRGIAVPKFVNDERETGKIAFTISKEYDTDLHILIDNIANGTVSLSTNEENKIVADLICGVHQLFKKNVANSDLKLDNIFIDKDKNAYIGDWGTLREKIDEIQELHCNLGHRAPESTYTNIGIPRKNEIWGMGLIFYRLFAKDNSTNMLVNVMNTIRNSENAQTCQTKINDMIDKDDRISNEQKDFLKKVLVAEYSQRPDIEMVAKLAKDILGIDSIPLREDFVPIKKPAIALQKKEPDRRTIIQMETAKKIQEKKKAETSPNLKPKQVQRERF
ncbi:MAG: hypothetical protein Ta2D_02070 [Rickettsiales bacterium]|nr:MAG: hypothetical protein Ta2D_02070 [Rickettsiales bacterium]